jgi:hypothetical protein
MNVTLEINNPYYTQGLEDMAQAVGVETGELCAAIVTKRIEDYVQAVRTYKRDLAGSYMPNQIEEAGE